MYAEEEADLLLGSGAAGTALERLIARRLAGEPLESILGWADFCGRRVPVDAGVFVPRRRTELLARLAVDALPADGLAVELCCGCGAVARVLADDVSGAEVHAADLDPVAVACARRTLAGAGGVHLGDLYAALPVRLRGRVDVLVANAPYVPSEEIRLMPSEARDHEPRAALDGGADGVDVHRRICRGAPDWLAPSGVLLVETSPAQAASTCAAFADAGLDPEVRVDEELGGCVVSGRLRGAARG